MSPRISLVLSATALVVALLGSTPLGEAARQAIPPLAKHAKTAGYATNAGAVNGIRASRLPRAGRLVPLGADGKFAASVGQVGPAGAAGPQGGAGPQGPKGDTGAPGAPGLSALQIVTANSASNNTGGLKEAEATCPSGKKVVGGGAQPVSSPAYFASGYPVSDNAFHAVGNSPAGPAFSVRAFAICATVAG
jgi:hypothetical protein